MNRRHAALAVVVLSSGAVLAETAWANKAGVDRQAPRCSEEMSALLLRHARKHGVPIDLLHRVVIRESRYNAAARHSHYYGLMQITYPTAKSMGYHGTPNGLLDAETNLTYAVPYLANAYMLAHGNDDRAVRLYAAGYYATAKQQHMIADLRTAESPDVVPVRVAIVQSEAPRNPVARLFGLLTSPAPAPEATSAVAAPAEADAASDVKADKIAPAEKAVASAASGKPAAHEAKPLPAKVGAAEKLQVAAATDSKPEDRLQGAAEPVPAGFSKAAAPETAAQAVAPGKPAKLQVATAAAKSRRNSARLAKKTRPSAEPATEVADAAAPETVADNEPAETAPAAKASGPKTKKTRAAKQVAGAAAVEDAAPEADTTHVAKHAAAKPRHAHVQQAAASKAEVTPDP